MSQAFVRENEEQWLHEIQPTLNALIVYLTRENNGVRVYEQKNFTDPNTGKEIHVMSNGLSYSKDNDGKWFVFDLITTVSIYELLSSSVIFYSILKPLKNYG